MAGPVLAALTAFFAEAICFELVSRLSSRLGVWVAVVVVVFVFVFVTCC